MEHDFFEAFYKTQYERLEHSFSQRTNRYRWFTRVYQISLLVSSAIAPVIIALSDNIGTKIIAIAVSSFVAILAGIGRIFRFEDAWMNSRATRNALWRENTCYHAGLFDYAGCPDNVFLFVVENYLNSRCLQLKPNRKITGINQRAGCIREAHSGATRHPEMVQSVQKS